MSVVIARLGELAPGATKKFVLSCDGREVQGCLLCAGGAHHAYVNRCRHVPMALDWVENQFFTDDGRWVQCATHGAYYRPETGECVAGPPCGRSLFALSHTGAIAGNIQAYEAVFEHYGAHCVDDPDELVAALQLFSTGKRPAPGKGLVAILDSGGERELLADMADRKNVPFAEIGDETKANLAARLDFGLEAENPLDAWGTGHGFETLFEACLGDLLDDPEAGIGLWVADLRDGESYHERYAESAMRLAATRDKPLAFATCYTRCRNANMAVQLRDAGVPVLEGMRASNAAVRSMMNYSAFLSYDARRK